MVMDTVVERFVEQTPVTVMARLALQRALEPAWLDALFEEHRQTQYTRELLFSTTVEIMSVVAVGLRPSVHAAAKACIDHGAVRQDQPRRAWHRAGTGPGQCPAA